MKSQRLATPAILLGLAVAALQPARAVTLVNDTFTDTDRIGGQNGASTTSSTPAVNAPTSTNTQWIGTRVSQITASASGMFWAMDANSRLVTGYFPTVTLANNTVTTFAIAFTTGNDGATPNNLRIALTDGTANGIRTTDGVAASDATYNGDVGYAFFSGNNLGGGFTTNLTMNTRERTTTSSLNLLGTAAEWTSLGSGSSGATGYFQPNTAYSMTFAFSYDGSATTITTGITGGNFSGMSYSNTDTSTLVTNFNQFTLRLGGGSAQYSSLNFTSFTVDQVSPVPEPSACAALAGAAGLGLAAFRRRRG